MRLTRFRALPVAAAALATLTLVAGAGDAAPPTPTPTVKPVIASAAPAVPIAPSVTGGTPGFGAKPGTSSYIVVLRKDRATTPEAASRHAANAGVTPKHTYTRALQGYSADLTKEQLAVVKASPDVAYVEPDRIVKLAAQTTPTGTSRILGPNNAKLGIGTATDKRVDVDVAVIDSGVNDHPDLTVVARLDCRAPGATSELRTCVPGGFDDLGHGTHVAGTIGAINNAAGVVGVAPGARIWSLRVCAGVCDASSVVAAIDYVVAHKDEIEVANMSLYVADYFQPLSDAIAAGTDVGVTFVVIAGNDNQDAGGFAPANAPDAITVSALADSDGKPGGTGGDTTCSPSKDDQLAEFSNWGATVDIAAPGVCILSTSKDGGYEVKSGTSMAAPHVTGAVAALAASGPKPRTRADVMALRAKLLAAGNKNWTAIPRGANDPQEPLLDVHDPAVFAPALVTPPTPVTWQAGAPAPGGNTRSARAQCTGDPNGVYLFGGESSSSPTGTSASWRYDLQVNTWKRLADFPGKARTGMAAVCNGDGRIHVIGGATGANHWIYDTRVDAWISTPSLNRAVYNPALASWNGKVHVVGGQNSLLGAPSSSIDIYDETSKTWSTTTNTTQPTAQAGSVQVGKYLYLAGWWTSTSPTTNSAVVLRYDLESRRWMQGPSLPAARFGVALTATDQALYAIGGFTNNSVLTPTATVTRLDLKDFPRTSWTTADPLPRPLGWAGAVCAPAGPNAAVTSIGGTSVNATNPPYPGEVWRSVRYGERCALADTGRWQLGAPTPVADTFPQSSSTTARCTANPSVTYVIGGTTVKNTRSSEVWTFDATHGFWTRHADFPGVVTASSAVCTADGKVHVVGGHKGAPINQHWVYDPVTDAWTSAPALPVPVWAASVGAWGTKLVVLAGVEIPNNVKGSTRVQIYDTASRTWTAGAPMPVALGDAKAVQGGSSLYLVGGSDATGFQTRSLLRLDLVTMTWTTGVALPQEWRSGSVAVTSKGLYMLSGSTGSGPTPEVRRLELAAFATGPWTAFPSLPASQISGIGWCADSGTTDARIGVSAGRTGPAWALVEPSRTWQTVVTGERCE